MRTAMTPECWRERVPAGSGCFGLAVSGFALVELVINAPHSEQPDGQEKQTDPTRSTGDIVEEGRPSAGDRGGEEHVPPSPRTRDAIEDDNDEQPTHVGARPAIEHNPAYF
jgi:hypothetical protein